jgi:hypothetical protein
MQFGFSGMVALQTRSKAIALALVNMLDFPLMITLKEK